MLSVLKRKKCNSLDLFVKKRVIRSFSLTDWKQLSKVFFCFCFHRRSEEEVDMDKVTAAMVLTSLSTSPLVRSPPVRVSGKHH